MILKRTKIIFLILIINCLLLAVCFWIGIYQPKESGSTKSAAFLIQRGEGSKEIALNLEKEKLIEVWKKTFFKKMRKQLKNKIYTLDICKKCVNT